MTERMKALTWLAALVVAAFCISWALTPWADVVALVLVLALSVPATLFAGVYMFTRPWWTTAIGKAMLVSSMSLALLVDISLLYMWLGDDYWLRDAVRLTVYTLILAGACFKCYALFAPSWMRPLWCKRSGDHSLRDD
jgi:hypothetical protein